MDIESKTSTSSSAASNSYEEIASRQPERIGHAPPRLAVASLQHLLSSERLPWNWFRKPIPGKTFELVHAERAMSRYLERVIERMDQRHDAHPHYFRYRDREGADSILLRPQVPASKRVLNHILRRGDAPKTCSVRELLESRHRQSGRGGDAKYSIEDDLLPCLKAIGHSSDTLVQELDKLTPNLGEAFIDGRPTDHNHIGKLPDELLLQVMTSLPARALKDLLVTSKRLNRLADQMLRGQSTQAHEFRKKARQNFSQKINTLARTPTLDAFCKGLPALIKDSKHIGLSLVRDTSYIGGIAGERIVAVLRVLATCRGLRSVSVVDDSDGAASRLLHFLTELTSANPDLMELEVCVGRRHGTSAFQALAGIRGLTKVNLDLRHADSKAASDLLSNPTLRHATLKLGNRTIDGEAIGDAIAGNNALATLDLDDLTDAALQGMAPGLGPSRTLQSLKIAGDLRFAGVQALQEALARSASIADVSICAVGHDDVLAALAPMLSTNKSIRSLQVRMWRDSSDGAQALAQAMETNETLLALKCRFQMGPASAMWIAHMLAHNRSIEKIDFCYCELTTAAAEHLARGLKHNRTLKEIDFSSNGLNTPGLEALAEAMLVMPALTEVNLQSQRGWGPKLSRLLSREGLNVKYTRAPVM